MSHSNITFSFNPLCRVAVTLKLNCEFTYSHETDINALQHRKPKVICFCVKYWYNESQPDWNSLCNDGSTTAESNRKVRIIIAHGPLKAAHGIATFTWQTCVLGIRRQCAWVWATFCKLVGSKTTSSTLTEVRSSGHFFLFGYGEASKFQLADCSYPTTACNKVVPLTPKQNKVVSAPQLHARPLADPTQQESKHRGNH